MTGPKRARRGAVVMVGYFALAGCSSPVSAAYRSHASTSRTAEPTAPVEVVVAGAGFNLHAPAPVARDTAEKAWAGALATLNRYVAAGVVTPLASGGPAGDLAPFFTADAGQRVRTPGPDRSAFLDEGLPPASGIRQEVSVATLAGLAGPDGVMSVVTAQLELRIKAEIDGAPLAIVRTGELVLFPDGGTWKIDAYDIRVTRDSVGTTTTTRARSK